MIDPVVLGFGAVFLGMIGFYWMFRPDPLLPRLVREALGRGAIVLDVRTRDEYRAGHVPDAINIPVDELEPRIPELKAQGKPVVVYCASGLRSAIATSRLAQKGLDVIDAGAYSRWPVVYG